MDEPQGRARGGLARAEVLSPKSRKDIAKKAAAARWDNSIPTATHIGELKIGDLNLPCAVLADGTRVISQGGVTTAFGPVTGGWQQRQRASDEDMEGLPSFLVAKSLQLFISPELRGLMASPRKYRDPRGGPIRVGLEASLLPKVCEVWLQARDADSLTTIQKPVAERADILMRGLAHVGIIALVDEATGYQKDRARDALAEILEQFIAKELQPYIRLFPAEFYENLYRLRGLELPRDAGKKPRYFGHLTNDIVYARLAPGVLEELRRVVPRRETGSGRKYPFTRRLTEDLGHPKLREHLASVTTIMRLSNQYDDFEVKLDLIHPRYDTTLPLPFYDEAAN